MRGTGSVACWGYMFIGLIDDVPFYASVLGPLVMEHVGDDTVQMGVGWEMFCLLTRAGQAKCWGAGNSGQLGNGSSEDTVVPHDVADIAGERYVELAMGGRHTCGVTTTGGVMCWGRNPSGQLGGPGPDQLLPTAVGIEDVLHVAAGRAHSCALKEDGSVWCWGSATWGQLGGAPLGPVPVGLPGATAISARGDQSCALTSEGAVWCWGDLESSTNPSPPTEMLDASFGATAIACGYAHSCAMNAAHQVRCWGDNSVGQTAGGELAL
jgi:alpha-tubulin suppressor-like RCC1 family protein